MPLLVSQCNYELTIIITSPGIVVDEEAKDIIGQGRELKDLKPKKEDIVQE